VMALYAAEFALYKVLNRLQIEPKTMAGHSVGQDFALWAAGAFVDYDEEQDDIILIRGEDKTQEPSEPAEAIPAA